MKWELDLWYEMWDRAGSQGLDTWYELPHANRTGGGGGVHAPPDFDGLDWEEFTYEATDGGRE